MITPVNPVIPEQQIKRVHKPKQHTFIFGFYLEAWMHCRINGVTKYDLKRTGAREWTLKYVK